MVLVTSKVVIEIQTDRTLNPLDDEPLLNRDAMLTAMQNLKEAVVMTDRHGMVTYMNPAAEALTGWKFEEARGRKRNDVYTYNDEDCSLHGRDGSKTYVDYEEVPLNVGEGGGQGTVAIFRDIRRRVQRQQEREWFTRILEATPDFVAMTDVEGKVLYYNEAARRMLGIGPGEDVRGISITDTHTEPAALLVQFEGLPTAERMGRWIGKTVLKSRDGKEIPVSQVILAHKSNDGVTEYFSTIARDLSAFKIAEEQRRLADTIIENLSEAVMVMEESGKVVSVNPAFTHITGLRKDEVLGISLKAFLDERHDARFICEVQNVLRNEGHWRGEIWSYRKNGELYVSDVKVHAIQSEDAEHALYAVVFEDISDRKEAEEKIRHQAYYDSLTGLPNRAHFYDYLTKAMKDAEKKHSFLGLMFVDLDGFKSVNDALGHHMGDLLLQKFSDRVVNLLRKHDMIARHGGDEFLILLSDLGEIRDLENLAKRILQAVREPFVIEGHTLVVEPSVGISIFPGDGKDPDTLIKHADAAMYHAKRHGHEEYQFYRHLA